MYGRMLARIARRSSSSPTSSARRSPDAVASSCANSPSVISAGVQSISLHLLQCAFSTCGVSRPGREEARTRRVPGNVSTVGSLVVTDLEHAARVPPGGARWNPGRLGEDSDVRSEARPAPGRSLLGGSRPNNDDLSGHCGFRRFWYHQATKSLV